MANSVNMNDTEIFAMWIVLHEKKLRKLRNAFERDTHVEIGFNQFSYYMYLECQDLIGLHLN